MATIIPSFFSSYFSFLVLLLHLGCFFTTSSHHRRRSSSHHHIFFPSSSFSTFKKKLTLPTKNLTALLRRLVLLPSPSSDPIPHPSSIPSPSYSTRSLRLNPPTIIFPAEENNNSPFSLSDDIFPCSICGEIFQNPALLEQHQSAKHAVSELVDGENIVRIIFKMGWPEKGRPPAIHRILKIHNSSKILTQFEEYREFVKEKAAAKFRPPSRDERCIADGNELLRFHCTTFMCELSDSTICNHQYCCVCGIIRFGFSSKMDGISTFPTSWTAHVAVPEDIEEEFGFMNVRRALLVCRVVAGRVGCNPEIVDKDSGFDSLVGQGSDGFEEELLVFNPRAVLPCFVIVYTV